MDLTPEHSDGKQKPITVPKYLHELDGRLARVASVVVKEFNAMRRAQVVEGAPTLAVADVLGAADAFEYSRGVTRFGVDAVGFFLAAELAQKKGSGIEFYATGFDMLFGHARAAIATHHAKGESFISTKEDSMLKYYPANWPELMNSLARQLEVLPTDRTSISEAIAHTYPDAAAQRQAGSHGSIVQSFFSGLLRSVARGEPVVQAEMDPSSACQILGQVLGSTAATMAYYSFRLGPEFQNMHLRVGTQIVRNCRDALSEVVMRSNTRVPDDVVSLIDNAEEAIESELQKGQ